MALAAQFLDRRAWVANHDGNVTARADANRFVATPTATAKRQVDERTLIEVDDTGRRVAGSAKPFGELNLHLLVYARRPDVGAVVHAHPPHATALAASGRNLVERPFIAEAVVSIGPWIPLVPFAMPGDGSREALAPYVEEVDAALMENHGAIAWGADVEQALLRLELVEHLARIATLAEATGGVRPLPESAVRELVKKRAKAGLGAAADRAEAVAQRGPGGARKTVTACAPAPHASVDTAPPGGASRPTRDELTALIKEELVRALK